MWGVDVLTRRIAGAAVLLVAAAILSYDSLIGYDSVRLGKDDGAAVPAAGRRPSGTKQPGFSVPTIPQSYREFPLRFLSTAPPESLVLLPGIGPVLAERVVGARTGKRLFTDWEDLLAVKGIGPKKLQLLRSVAAEEH